MYDAKKNQPMLLALALLAGCRGPLPCPDCMDDDIAEDNPDDAEDAEPLPDLPCGGADLMTDNVNCGSCGNECPVWYEGTEWEAGTCVDGKCGPYWTRCSDNPYDTCSERCAALGRSCVAQGCSGMTAMLFYDPWDGFDPCSLSDDGPDVAMIGSCDEPIPWETTIEYTVKAMCCCDGP